MQLGGQLVEAGGEDLLFWPVSEYQLFELLDIRTLTQLLRQIFIVIQALHSGPAGEEVPAICGQAPHRKTYSLPGQEGIDLLELVLQVTLKLVHHVQYEVLVSLRYSVQGIFKLFEERNYFIQ